MGETLVRIEVWFLNGTRQDDNVLRAFPHVSKYEEDSEEIRITFGGSHHTAVIQKRNVLFIEMMKEED